MRRKPVHRTVVHRTVGMENPLDCGSRSPKGSSGFCYNYTHTHVP